MAAYFDDIFGDIFGNILAYGKPQEERLDEYWEKGKVKEYYHLLNTIKTQGYRVLRNSAGKHICRKG